MHSKDTLEQAKDFLRHDFLWVLKRTQRLYVRYPKWKSIWPKTWKLIGKPNGYFEPALLCFSWCDFLGALYHGGGGSKARSIAWLQSAYMTDRNKRYGDFARALYVIFRCGLAHGYCPQAFTINFSPNTRHNHLTWVEKSRGHAEVHVPCLIDDLIEAIDAYTDALDRIKSGPGSLECYRRGWKHMEHEFRDGLHEVLTGKRPNNPRRQLHFPIDDDYTSPS